MKSTFSYKDVTTDVVELVVINIFYNMENDILWPSQDRYLLILYTYS